MDESVRNTVNREEKVKVSTIVVSGKLLPDEETMNLKKVKTAPGEGTGKEVLEKPQDERIVTWRSRRSSQDFHNGSPGRKMDDPYLVSHVQFNPPKSARLWFDELKPESIDSFKDLRKKFLAYYVQQKRYTIDPVELCHVKQGEGESTEAFMECFTSESLLLKVAP
ncbi:reverse transcriptase domain-containing protein [Tanacetum coccineum]